MPRPIRSPVRESFAAVFLLALGAAVLGPRLLTALLAAAVAAAALLRWAKPLRVLRARRPPAPGAGAELPPG